MLDFNEYTKRVILTHFLLLLDQSPLLQDCGIFLICRTLYLLTESALLSHCWSFFMGLIITTSTTFIFGLASLRFLLFTFISWTHLFCTFLLFYGIHSWLHPSIVFSGSVNSFRGFDQFQPLFQASILWPNRDTFPELLCTYGGKRSHHEPYAPLLDSHNLWRKCSDLSQRIQNCRSLLGVFHWIPRQP